MVESEISLIETIALGVDSEILKRVDALGRPPSLADEENFRFQVSKMAKITLETISYWRNISVSIFKFFPSLYTMKACL